MSTTKPLSNESTILLLTHSIPSAQAFVARLTASTSKSPSHSPTDSCTGSPDSSLLLPWSIKNKYYSADVVFRIILLSEDEDFSSQDSHSSDLHGIPAVLYLLPSNQPASTDIPSTLKHILTLLSPEISLAVLPRHLSPKLDRDDVPSASKSHVGPSDACLDVYDDLGMELVDEEETAHDEEVEGKDGDEESLLDRSPLAQISETLQTHLWPDLTLRKAQPQKSSATTRERSLSDSSSTSSTSPQPSPKNPVAFPTSFPSSPKTESSAPALPSDDDDDFKPFQSASSNPHDSSSNSLHPSKKETPTRTFTDSFNPSSSSPSSSSTKPSLQDDFPELAPKDGEPMDASDFTSTLASLRALREEIGKVEDEDERRVLAGKIVEGLFGFEELEGEEDDE